MPDPVQPKDLPLDEDLWRDLRRLMECHEGFTLVLLYSDDTPTLSALRRRMTDAMGFQTTMLQHVVPASPGSAVSEVMRALHADPRFPSRRPPVWIELHGSPGDDAWNVARDTVLARLNEQRSRLEREVPGIVVITLPTRYIPRIGGVAPDLWSVRTLSREVVPRRREPPPVPVEHAAPVATVLGPAAAPSMREELLMSEWSRWRDGTLAAPPPPHLLKDLVQLALDRGDPGRAMGIASEAVSILRPPAHKVHAADMKRAFATAMEVRGNVAFQTGRMDEAGEAWRESLAIRRRLLEEVGPTSEALRDLSISLKHVGQVEFALGRWEQAGEAWREGLGIVRQLMEKTGPTPEALRDLAVSLDHLGRVESVLGLWEQAGEAWRESLAISRRMVEGLGPTPGALRDLSVSLDHVGEVESALGRWEQAGEAWRESLAINRRIVEELGSTPMALRDLSISLDHVGQVESALGRWQQAGEAWRESLAIRRRLMDCLGAMPQTQGDLASVLGSLASWEKEHGTPAAELACLREWEDVMEKTLPTASDRGATEARLASIRERTRELQASAMA